MIVGLEQGFHVRLPRSVVPEVGILGSCGRSQQNATTTWPQGGGAGSGKYPSKTDRNYQQRKDIFRSKMGFCMHKCYEYGPTIWVRLWQSLRSTKGQQAMAIIEIMWERASGKARKRPAVASWTYPKHAPPEGDKDLGPIIQGVPCFLWEEPTNGGGS